MVVLNKNNEAKTLDTKRFKEIIAGYKSGRNIITSTNIADISKILVPAKSAMIIEFKK
jgi:hypothetical protein